MAKSENSPAQLPAVTPEHERALVDPSRLDHAGLRHPESAPPGDMQVHQLLSTLRRRSGLIFAAALLGAIAAGMVALFIPPQYTARAQVVVEPPRQVPGTATDAGAAVVDALAIDTQITMLVARDHLRAVLASLAEDRARQNEAAAASQGAQAGSGPMGGPQLSLATVRRLAGSVWTGLSELVGKGSKIPSFGEFEKTLRIDQERKSRVITLRYTSHDAEFSAAAINRIIELYTDGQAVKAQAAGQAELAVLDTRMSELEQKMAATEQNIRNQLAGQSAEPSGAQLRKLEREVVENTKSYERLAQRQSQLRAEIDTHAPSFKVLYLATPPEQPSSLNTKYFVLPAIILAMLGGGVMAVIRESFDRTLRSENQVLTSLGIHCVALVPKLTWFQRRRPHEYLLKKPYSPYAEAIRYTGAALQFGASEGKRPKLVQITSGVRDEGKTTLAASLAVYATRMYPRVLLLDLDLRKPSIGEMFKLRADTNILDLVADHASVEEAVHHLPGLGLDVLPLTVCPIDPVTLFANGELGKFLDFLRKEYDFIVVDSPPLLGVTESTLLGSLSDMVLFATKWGTTRAEVARNALAEFEAIGWTKQVIASRVKAVVTQVDLRRHAMYQYGDSVETMVRYSSNYEPYHSMKTVVPPKKKIAANDDHSPNMAAE